MSENEREVEVDGQGYMGEEVKGEVLSMLKVSVKVAGEASLNFLAQNDALRLGRK